MIMCKLKITFSHIFTMCCDKKEVRTQETSEIQRFLQRYVWAESCTDVYIAIYRQLSQEIATDSDEIAISSADVKLSLMTAATVFLSLIRNKELSWPYLKNQNTIVINSIKHLYKYMSYSWKCPCLRKAISSNSYLGIWCDSLPR